MDRKLYVERWLLALKDACTQAGFQAHVRALDQKGGKRLALEVRQGDDALTFFYRKRLTGARMVVVATSGGLVTRVKEIHARLLNEHRRLLENGLRRFLNRSIRLLTEIEDVHRRDAEFPRKLNDALTRVPEVKGQPAALARRVKGLPARYEVLPAVAVTTPDGVRFAAIVDRTLVDPVELIQGEEKPAPPAPSGGITSAPGRPRGVELVTLTAPAVAAGAAGMVAQGNLEDARAAAAATVPPPAAPPAGGGDGVDAAAVVLEGVAEVVASAGSCPGDAACAAPDCTGIDVSGIDCGGLDCGGIG